MRQAVSSARAVSRREEGDDLGSRKGDISIIGRVVMDVDGSKLVMIYNSL